MAEINIPTAEQIKAATEVSAQTYSAGGQYLCHQALGDDELTGW